MLIRPAGRMIGLREVGRSNAFAGRGGELSSRPSRQIFPTANLAARFDANIGVTSASGLASQWNDISGNSRHLLQATGGNQPIHLPYVGTKYGWLPGVAGNYFSTPDSVAVSTVVTGSLFVCEVDIAHGSWTSGSDKYLAGQLGAVGNRSWAVGIVAGSMMAYLSSDGTNYLTGSRIDSTAALPGYFANSARGKLRYSRNSATGAVQFHYSIDGGVVWTQLGTDKATTSGALFHSTAPVEVGTVSAGASPGTSNSGGWYRVSLSASLGGAEVASFDPSRWTTGTTFTASTGETWTINSTGSKPAQIVDRPSLLFDGAAHYMKCNSFTLNQPETVYLVAKQVSWTNQDYFYDGNATNTGVLYQNNATPQLSIYAGSIAGADTNLAVGSRGVVCALFNGASSSLQVNGAAAATVNAGALNMSGFTVGANAAVSNFGNIQVNEALIYSVAPDSATRANVIRALMSKWGIP